MSAVAPVKRVPEVDFRSGTTLEELSAQVHALVMLEQGEFGDQTALEVHTAKDFIFNMLGEKNTTVNTHLLKYTPNRNNTLIPSEFS